MYNLDNAAAALLAARGINKQASSIGDFLSDNAGAIIGGLAGLGGGSALGSSLLDDSKLDEETRRKLKTRGGILGGLTGAIAGGLGGHLLHGKLGGGVEVPVQSQTNEASSAAVTAPTVAQAVGSNETGTEAAAEESYTPEEVDAFIDKVRRGAGPIEVVDRNRVRQAMRYFDPNADDDAYNARYDAFDALYNISAPFRYMGFDTKRGPVGKALESGLLEGIGIRKKSHFNKQASSIGDFLTDNAGAITGGILGLGTGAITGSELMDDEEMDADDRSTARLTGGILGALTGGALGGVGGHYLHGMFRDTPTGNQGDNGVGTEDTPAPANKVTSGDSDEDSLWQKTKNFVTGAYDQTKNFVNDTFHHKTVDAYSGGAGALAGGAGGYFGGLRVGRDRAARGKYNREYTAQSKDITNRYNDARTRYNNARNNIRSYQGITGVDHSRDIAAQQKALDAARNDLVAARKMRTNLGSRAEYNNKRMRGAGARGGVVGAAAGFGLPWLIDAIFG